MIKKILAILCSNTYSRLDEFLQIFGDDLEGFLPIYEAFGGSLEKVREFLDAKCAGRFWELNRLAKEHGAAKLPSLLLDTGSKGLRPPSQPPKKTGVHTLKDVKPSDDDGGGDGGPHGGGGGGLVENRGSSTLEIAKTESKPETPPTLHLVLRLRGMPEEDQIEITEPSKHASEQAANEAMGLYTRLIKLMMTAFQGTVGEDVAFDARERLSVEQLLNAATDEEAFATVFDAIAELIQIIFASAHQVGVWEEFQRRLEQYVRTVSSEANTDDPADEIVRRLKLPSRRQVEEMEPPSTSKVKEPKPKIEDEPKVEDDVVQDDGAMFDHPIGPETNPGWELGRQQLDREIAELRRRLRELYLACVGDDRLQREVEALKSQVEKLNEVRKQLGTAGPALMKEIRLQMKACDLAAWNLARSLQEMIQLDEDLAQLLREERAKHKKKKKKAPTRNNEPDDGEDEEDDILKVTWSWGSTITGQMTALQKDGIWGEIEAITHLVGQSRYVSVQGGFVTHGALQSFHCVGTKLYESYLSTKELGSGSELRCFYRVDIYRYKDGRVWVHFTIVAIADHILKNVKPRSEDFGKRGDGPNLPPGFGA